MIGMRARVERYPAKMIKRLADKLLDTYCVGAGLVLDPFCGSGEVLYRASQRGLAVVGWDVNPIATLLAGVRLEGFRALRGRALLDELMALAKLNGGGWPVPWGNKRYWFTPRVLSKLERVRRVAEMMQLRGSPEGRSVLLALALAVRVCSRADERSPKPFISKEARRKKRGRHVDPFRVIGAVHAELTRLYGDARRAPIEVSTQDATSPRNVASLKRVTHIITSPPYLNAQDYFRNFKLELFVMEGLLSYSTTEIRDRFVGTERGRLEAEVCIAEVVRNRELLPQLLQLEMMAPRHAAVVHKYLHDMRAVFLNLRAGLRRGVVLVVVCGDNLVAGLRVPTWQGLNGILSELGFDPFDSFADPIRARALAPRRLGHRGLIKEERVTAFRLARL